jgi:hypothetical protein
MIVTIHQPEHLPWLGFFDKMRQADVFVLLDTTQFAKDDFQNRNRIKTKNGPAWLTVPIFKKGRSEQLIIDVEICNDRNWRNRCWSLIYQSYRDAPYFKKYAPFFKELYMRKWSRLVTLNETINLTICRRLGADIYLSGKHGRDYLDETRFAEQSIEVRYQDFKHPVYPQLWGDFLPRMSSIDLLFHCGESSLRAIELANA